MQVFEKLSFDHTPTTKVWYEGKFSSEFRVKGIKQTSDTDNK